MENTPNNNFNNFNGTNGVNPVENPAGQNFQVPPVAPPPVNQGYAPNFPPPAYQYPPQYVPTYTPPSYTAPNTMPYGYQATAYNTGAQYQQSPSAVYNNAQTGAPQYHYGNPTMMFNNTYYLEHQEKLRKKKEAEKKIRHIGNVSGALLIACFIIAFLFSMLLAIPAVSDLYASSLTGSSFINMLYTIVVVGGTFLIFGRCYKAQKKTNSLQNNQEAPSPIYKTNYALPKNHLKSGLLILIGFGGCMIANFISTYILALLEAMGVHSTYSSIEDPKGITDTILMFLAVSVIPPLVEEFAMRGVVLNNLRKYGSAFAILASSFMFGIFHGNAAQILFAFICGLFFAYAVIATDSIWPAVIIHALNNAMSGITSIILQFTDEEVANIFFYVCAFGGIILGGVALIIYLTKFKDEKILQFQGEASELTVGQKMAKFIGSPVMIAAIVIYGIEALLTLTTQAPNV